MPNYWRKRVPGGSYFFTVVTADRMPWLTTELGRTALRGAIEKVQELNPFTLDAIVLLPDHLHAIWTLPPGDDEYSTRWSRIKELATRTYLAGSGVEAPRSTSRRRKRERGVWQRRFWEHAIVNDDDYKRCLDYLHWNPVKHGLVERVRDYEYSTFNKFVQLGEYDIDRGSGAIRDIAGAEWE